MGFLVFDFTILKPFRGLIRKEKFKHWTIILMENKKSQRIMIKTFWANVSFKFSLNVINLFLIVICRVINLLNGFFATPSENKSFKGTHNIFHNIFLFLCGNQKFWIRVFIVLTFIITSFIHFIICLLIFKTASINAWFLFNYNLF